jgi:hypothetical protein
VTRFEYFFTLFGLLLGFILIEVMSGLVRTLRARHPTGPGVTADIRIGWLTPLLGAFVLLDVTSWWGNVWSVHETLPLGYDTMFGGVVLAGIYYFAASMVFPGDPKAWPDLDEWFWLYRRQVLGCILAANLVWGPLIYALTAFHPGAGEIGMISVYFAALLIALCSRRNWLVAGALVVLVGQFVMLGIIQLVSRQFGG